MDIIYKHGDLMTASERFIAHGCNAQGVMGSGVAKLIRDKYPEAYERYVGIHKMQGLELGDVDWTENTEPHFVINIISQEFYGRDPNVVYVSYDALRKAFRHLNACAADGVYMVRDDIKLDALAMPLIGAGLANGRWSIISKIIEEEATNFQPIVYLVDGIIPDGIIPSTDIVKL